MHFPPVPTIRSAVSTPSASPASPLTESTNTSLPRARARRPTSATGFKSPVVVSWCTTATASTSGAPRARSTAARSGGSVHGPATTVWGRRAASAMAAMRSPYTPFDTTTSRPHAERTLVTAASSAAVPQPVTRMAGQPPPPGRGGEARAVHAVRHAPQPPACGEDAGPRRLERRRARAGDEDGGEAAPRREGAQEPRADRRLEGAVLGLAVAEVAARQRRRHPRRDVHRAGVEKDHRSVPSARLRRATIASGVCGTRGAGGPG